MGKNQHSEFRIVILASGNGTNAERIMTYFADSELAEVALVLTNNPDAGVLSRAEKAGVNALTLSKNVYAHGEHFLEFLEASQPDLIVCAGYLKLVPAEVVTAFEGRIINIHPSLLPKYGGKGMYGMRVHEAVIANGDAQSGITIHQVNEVYDQGEILLQERIPVESGWTPSELAQAIHKLEHAHFPRVIESLLKAKQAGKSHPVSTQPHS